MLLTFADIATLGAKRVSVGGSLARAAFGSLMRAGREMREQGTFTYSKDAVSHRELCTLFASE